MCTLKNGTSELWETIYNRFLTDRQRCELWTEDRIASIYNNNRPIVFWETNQQGPNCEDSRLKSPGQLYYEQADGVTIVLGRIVLASWLTWPAYAQSQIC